MSSEIQITRGDITKLAVEVIVNAANRSLLGGGGVDGAIHRAAGPMLLQECRQLNGCGTGEAKITKGYNLPAKLIIHTVGPVWTGGTNNEEQLLKNCYRNSFNLASGRHLKSIAFPNISTGIYGFPKKLAANIALSETFSFIETGYEFEKILFVCFDEENYQLYTDWIKTSNSVK